MINGKTKLVCLLGSPVEHSFSPMMHNASFEKLNINAKYLAFDVTRDSLKNAVEGLKSLNFIGTNVTIPHKIDILEFLDEIDPRAKAIGACNTIVNKRGKLFGYNTDVDGFIESFRRLNFNFNNKKIAVFGTGGASKAVIVGLLWEGVEEIHIFSRTKEKVIKYASSFSDERIKPMIYSELSSDFNYDVVVNTTPVGMHPNEGVSVVDVTDLGNKDTVFYDLIYNPLETEFLRQARVSGRQTINGLDMLIYQGIYALRHWFDFDHSQWTQEDVLAILKANEIV